MKACISIVGSQFLSMFSNGLFWQFTWSPSRGSLVSTLIPLGYGSVELVVEENEGG